MEPLVSVVICAYNREKYIKCAIESVLLQDFGDYEIIIVDDASEDGTVESIAEYLSDSRIRLLSRKKNSGRPAVARNEGSRLAKGRYIAFLDSDDYWLPGKLSKQLDYMECNPECLLCHTYCQIEEPDGRHIYIRMQHNMPQDDGDVYRELLKGCFITTSTVVVRRDIYTDIGGFCEDHAYTCGEDRLFFLNISAKGRIGFIPEVLAVYRKHNDNICGSGQPVKLVRNLLNGQRRIIMSEVLCRNREDRRVAKLAYVDECLGACYAARKVGDYFSSLEYSLEGLRFQPMSMKLYRQLLVSVFGRLISFCKR